MLSRFSFHRFYLLLPIVLALPACATESARYCSATESCSAGFAYCDLEGICAESGYITNTCIATPCWDAGLEASDALSNQDGDPAGLDATVDAVVCETCSASCGTIDSCGAPLVCGDPCEIVFVQEFGAQTPIQDDQFGRQIAIAGDTIMVGTASEDTDGIGDVSVFRRAGTGTWSYAHKLSRSGPGIAEDPGALSIEPQLALVGAYSTDDGANASTGAVYVFEPNGAGNWQEAAKLQAPDRAAYDRFGARLDLNGATAVVGAFSKNSNTGAAYVFEKDAAGWQGGRLPDNAVADDRFGYDVAISSDKVVIVGSPRAPAAAGSVYVFEKVNDVWAERQVLSGMAGFGINFGEHVAIQGDVLVASSSPYVYVFRRTAGTWSFEQRLDIGGSVHTVEVGDQMIGVAGFKSGTGDNVWLFQRNGATWTETNQYALGTSIAFDGDLIAIGLQYKDGPGRAAVYRRNR